MPGLFADLGAFLVEASNTNDSFKALEEAHRIAHMLNGTAGSLGFSDVSTAVHAVESALKEMLRIRRMTSVPAVAPFSEIVRASEETGFLPEHNRAVTAKVLVIDDDEDFLSSVAAMGNENLIQVYKAQNKEEALRVLQDHRVDAAIIG